MLKKIFKFLSPRYQTLFLEYKVSFKPRYGNGKPPHGQLYELINENREQYRTILGNLAQVQEKIHEIRLASEEKDCKQPTWNNGFLPGLDIIGIYLMIAYFKPKLYVEVGSGNSTKVAFKARNEQSPETKIISIDPMPRAEIDQLADNIIRKPFEDIEFSYLDSLEENDILFIDNSHRVLPNSDGMVFFMEVLPRLKKGVIVQIHDIYLPYDYPQFMCDRFYSEQYTLAAFLLANPKKYAPLLPNFFISEDVQLSKQIESFWSTPTTKQVEKHGGSFWLRIES
jgi:hypothetical protein